MTRRALCFPGITRRVVSVPAIALLLAGCVSADPDAIASLKVPESAPRVTGVERAVEREQQRLAASLGGRYRWAPMDSLLNRVVERIARVTGRPANAYSVEILNSPTINAFALPNGKVYVTRGLLELARDEGEVAAVIAHEIAHVTLEHARARAELAQRSALVTRVVADVLNDPNASRVAKSEGRVTLARFSRAQKLEADRIGVNVIARAGYDPYSAARFLVALDRHAKLRSGNGGKSADFLSSHPSTPERVSAAISVARETGASETTAGAAEDYAGAINGMLYGDDPSAGVVRGRVFASPRLAVTFTAPEGYVLDASPEAVIGLAHGGSAGALRFDHIADVSDSLEAFIASGWIDGLEARNVHTLDGGAAPMVVAEAQGKDWMFLLGAVRIDNITYRLLYATRAPGAQERARFEESLRSIRKLTAEEARAVAPLRIRIVTARPEDTQQSLAARMQGVDNPLARFAAINGLREGEAPVPGYSYKIVD